VTPLLLLHPLGSDSSFWSTSAELLGRPVLTPDLPGHGAADLPAPHPDAAAYAASVADGLDGPVVAIGVSLGGVVALALADRHPELVSGLVLADAVPVYPQPLRDAWPERAAVARSGGLESLADGMETMWFGPAFKDRHPAIVASARRTFVGTDPEGYARACELLHQVDLTAALTRVAVPALVVCGEHDAPAFVEAAPAVAAALPDGVLRWIHGAQHAAVLEQPEVFAALVRDFLEVRGL
jgi:3-oxoadipate enol-lactonase